MRYTLMQLAAAACAVSTLPTPALGQEPTARSVEPQTARCPAPEYPRAAQRAEVEGRTVVALTVEAAGHVSQVTLEQKSGDSALHALLDGEAVRVTRACRFPEAAGLAPAMVRRAFLWRLQ